MKNKQKGGMFVIMILTLMIFLGAGIYVYSEYRKIPKVEVDDKNLSVESEIIDSNNINDVKSTSSIKNEVANNSKKIEMQNNLNIKTKTFKDHNLYSFEYPENWTFNHDSDTGTDDYCLGNPNADIGTPCISVAYGQYRNYALPLTNATDPKARQIIIGKNPFTMKKETENGVTYEYYELPIGLAGGEHSYVLINIVSPSKFNRSEINLILSSLKSGPDASGINTNNISNANKDIETRDQFIKFKTGAKLFYMSMNSYKGLCNPLASDGNRANNYSTADVLLKLRQRYCGESKDGYILYSQLTTGIYLCTDSTNEYISTSKTRPTSTTCK